MCRLIVVLYAFLFFLKGSFISHSLCASNHDSLCFKNVLPANSGGRVAVAIRSKQTVHVSAQMLSFGSLALAWTSGSTDLQKLSGNEQPGGQHPTSPPCVLHTACFPTGTGFFLFFFPSPFSFLSHESWLLEKWLSSYQDSPKGALHFKAGTACQDKGI